jgi:hypothetical protein
VSNFDLFFHFSRFFCQKKRVVYVTPVLERAECRLLEPKRQSRADDFSGDWKKRGEAFEVVIGDEECNLPPTAIRNQETAATI